MKHAVLTLAFGLAFSFSAATPIQAQTPPEVLEPYKAYRTALAAKDSVLAADKAYEAWQAAEDFMGDTKTTGDLASNYAELNPRRLGNKPAWKQVVKAHWRSIDLASLHADEPAAMEIDRRTKYLTWMVSTLALNSKLGWEKKYGPEKLGERIAEFGMEGTTFHAESVAIQAHIASRRKRWKKAESFANEAIALFDARSDGIFSTYEYGVPVYLATAYSETDRKVDAALTYQELITKLEKSGGHQNPISATSYAEWIRLRDEIISDKNSDPRSQQVVNFVVPAGRAEDLSPLIRTPPIFPANYLKGNYSGFVKVKFNVDINGRVINPVITSSTSVGLHEATLESLKGWRYTPNLPAAKSQDIETTIRFNLQDESGNFLPDQQEVSRR